MQVAEAARPAASSLSVARAPGWLAATLALALLIGELPLLLAACCAPGDARGLGTAWFINDFAQYESAMRQGAEQPGWLVHDQFTAEPHAPAFMFALYVGIGKVAALLHLAPVALERVVEVLARGVLVLALWRFCHAFGNGRAAALAAVLLALFGSGFEAAAGLLGSSYAGNFSYETNTFGLLLAAPHVPLAMAATLELARRYLLPGARTTPWSVLSAAALAAAVAMLHPFHVPVLLSALGLAGLVFWRTGQGSGSLIGAAAAAIGAAPVLWLTVQTFSFDPFWAATYSRQNQLPSPLPHELLIDLGPTLLLAIGGVVAVRWRVAPFGLLVWLLLCLVAMYLPVPYQRRLAFGIEPALAILAGNALIAAGAALDRKRVALLRLGVVAVAASGTLLILSSVVWSGLRNWPLAVYRSTGDLDAAAAWLASRSGADDVVLANWQVSNYLAGRLRGRLVGGHPVATLNAADKQVLIGTVFAHASGTQVARQYGADWLVYGPDEAALPGTGTPDFQSGVVRVYRVSAVP
jgi:hypothetical protein